MYGGETINDAEEAVEVLLDIWEEVEFASCDKDGNGEIWANEADDCWLNICLEECDYDIKTDGFSCENHLELVDP